MDLQCLSDHNYIATYQRKTDQTFVNFSFQYHNKVLIGVLENTQKIIIQGVSDHNSRLILPV